MNGPAWLFLVLAVVEAVVIARVLRHTAVLSRMLTERTSAIMRAVEAAQADDGMLHSAFGLHPPSQPLQRPVRHSAPVSMPLNRPIGLPDREGYRP